MCTYTYICIYVNIYIYAYNICKNNYTRIVCCAFYM